MSSIEAILIMAVFFAVMITVSVLSSKNVNSKEAFLVGNRNQSWIMTAFSVAATWVWAPSIFLSSEKAYMQGLVGVFWFVVPNVATLLLFAFFASKFRKWYKGGFTFSDYMREKYGNRVHNTYLFESFGLQICSLAVQLLAGALVLEKITGIDFTLSTAILIIIPALYSMLRGIKGNIYSDFIKMTMIVVVLLSGVPILIGGLGMDTLNAGLGGITGDYRELFRGNGIDVMLSFGIPTTIGLLSGTFGDQMFWQRTFCVERRKVGKMMILAALIFAIVPTSLSCFGFFAAGSGLTIEDTQLTNINTIQAFMPRWFLYLFMLLILSGLTSTIDSILCACSSLAGHDIINRMPYISDRLKSNPVSVSKVMMAVVAVLGFLIANIPGITITYLFLFYGTLRSSVMIPTIYAIRGVRMHEKGLFRGLVCAIGIGLPIFAIGNVFHVTPMIVAGSLLTIGIPAVYSRLNIR